MTSPDLELALFRLESSLWTKLKASRDAEHALRAGLRATMEFFDAPKACLAELEAGGDDAKLVFELPDAGEWDLDLLGAFLRNERPELRAEMLMAPVRRRGRVWRVLALKDGDFTQTRREACSRVARTLSQIIEQIDHDRIIEVRSRIDRKIMEELRPKDLFYQILHGLRSLTGYDHSSTLLVASDSGEALQLAAEQIAWRKGKSDRIGMRFVVEPRLRGLIHGGEVYGFERIGNRWRDWTGHGAEALARLLDSNPGGKKRKDPYEEAMLCAPLSTKDGLVAVLKVASRNRGSLGRYEAELVRRFMPQVSVAIQNSRRTASLEAKMLQAEKKHAMANLARSISHDVNNAMGSVLPLVQQISRDVDEGKIDPAVLRNDLHEIERSLQVCRRIFGGMLAFARGAARGPGQGDVGEALEGALAIVRDGMERRSIQSEIDIPEDLPEIRCGQSELEQLLFNLLSNARDAMPRGGNLTVKARPRRGSVEITITDTGCGIAQRNLTLIREPFFTTKPQGNGLGLTICRSIVWEMRGQMDIESREGEGTTVRLRLPIVTEEQKGKG